MGKFLILTAVIIAGLSALAYNYISKIFADGEFETPLPDFFWGPKSLQGQKEDTKIYPFAIKIEEKLLQDLKNKLKDESSSNREVAPLEGIAFQYGFNSKYLKTVREYWLNKYNWRSREKMLNQYPQFKTKIAGIDIHFQHVKSKSSGKYKATRPLLLLHGWPGSFVEFQKIIIPMLTDPQDSDVNFELVIPSLPGYGFSEAAVRPGLGPVEMAQLFVKLMKRLGHNKFYAQGGDWGGAIIGHMSVIYPQNVVAMHSNLCLSLHPRTHLRTLLGSFFPSTVSAEDAPKVLPVSKFWSFIVEETGYAHIHATKPDTVGVGLTHSPSGIAAYILEKFSTWTNVQNKQKEDGGLTRKFTMDELLDNIMIYWFTGSITTSMRIYAENFAKSKRNYGLNRVPVKIPSACLVPGNEPYIGQSKEMLQDKFANLVRYTITSDGGNFFAQEHPDVLANDFIQFVKQIEANGKVTDELFKSAN